MTIQCVFALSLLLLFIVTLVIARYAKVKNQSYHHEIIRYKWGDE